MQNYVFAPGCLFNSETEEATTDRSYGRSALWANYEFLLLIISFYAFSGCCRRTHKLFELGKFHHPPTIAKTSVDARKARVGCRRKILLNSWSYGARWVADHLFDSMSSVVDDRAVAQADHSLPRYDGSNWCQCCHKSRHNSRSNGEYVTFVVSNYTYEVFPWFPINPFK